MSNSMPTKKICKICNKETPLFNSATILQKHNAHYYYCTDCKFLWVDAPSWLNEAYSSAISILDTGCIQRNMNIAQELEHLLVLNYTPEDAFLDFGAGNGVFTRMMRDRGFDYYWDDLYAENIFARGFEKIAHKKYAVVSAFELFEHLENPMAIIEEMLTLADTIIFSTEIIPSDPPPAFDDWHYYVLDGGQHIAFYSEHTFNLIANKYNLHYIRISNEFHIFTKKQHFKITLDTSEAEKEIKISFYNKVLRKIYYILRHKFEHDVNMNPSLVKELEYQEARSKFESYTIKDHYMLQQKNSI